MTKVYRRDATNLGPAHPLEPFSLAFLDPPYGKGLAEQALASLRDGGWLTPQALVVVEEATVGEVRAPAMASRSWSGAPMTIPSSSFLRADLNVKAATVRGRAEGPRAVVLIEHAPPDGVESRWRS